MTKPVSDMDPVELKIALMRAGVSLSQVARQVGVRRQSVYLVVNGRAVSHRIRQAIAEAVGMDLKRIWPSTYLYGGPRKPGRPAAE